MNPYDLILISSILGVLLIGYFGLPITYFEKVSGLEWGENHEKIYRLIGSLLGIVLIILGYILQRIYR